MKAWGRLAEVPLISASCSFKDRQMEASQDSSTSSKPAEGADGDAGSAGSHTTLGAGSGDGGGSQEREELSQKYEEMETASVRRPSEPRCPPFGRFHGCFLRTRVHRAASDG